MRFLGKQQHGERAQARIALLQVPGHAVEQAEYERRIELRDRGEATGVSPSSVLHEILGGTSALESLFAAREKRAELAESICDGSTDSWLPDVVSGIDGATTLWEGSPRLLVALMPALFDKLVFNLGRQPAEAHAFVRRVGSFTAERELRDLRDLATEPARIDPACIVPLVGQSDRIGKAARELGYELDPPAELLERLLRGGERLQSIAELICDLEMKPSARRLTAKTKMRPHANERIAELSFWGLLDWTMLALQAPRANQSLVRSLIKCLRYQSELYEERGLPQIREIGHMPFEAFNATTGLRTAYGPPLFDGS